MSGQSDCPDCDGTGLVPKPVEPGGKIGAKMTCFRCDGTGEICDGCGESRAVCDGDCDDEDFSDLE